MKLLEKISQHRRDFKGKYECENCGAIKTDSGLDSYDDEFFHRNVIPEMKCSQCNKSRVDLGDESVQISTKYAEGTLV